MEKSDTNPLKSIAAFFGVKKEDVSEDSIMSMVDEGHEQGVILESEALMIHRILELNDKVCEDIMTPRKSITALDGNIPFSEAFPFMLEQTFSRFPVYLDTIDHVIGMIHIRDAMIYDMKKKDAALPLKDTDLVRETPFVPETQGITKVLNLMRREKTHMVTVVDEYGQTSGIVAMEDIIEEIVGNIQDEHDNEEEMIIQRTEKSFLMNGMSPIEEVEDALGIDLEAGDIETLNGYLISRIDKIPEDNERFEVEAKGYEFKVLSVKNKTVRTVLVIKQ